MDCIFWKSSPQSYLWGKLGRLVWTEHKKVSFNAPNATFDVILFHCLSFNASLLILQANRLMVIKSYFVDCFLLGHRIDDIRRYGDHLIFIKMWQVAQAYPIIEFYGCVPVSVTMLSDCAPASASIVHNLDGSEMRSQGLKFRWRSGGTLQIVPSGMPLAMCAPPSIMFMRPAKI